MAEPMTLVLSQGQRSLVDPDDYEWASAFKWSALRCPRTGKFRAMRQARSDDGRRRTTYLSREIMGLKHGDLREVDHVNHDTLDDRRSNLRILTSDANKRWQPSRGGSSDYVGVVWDRDREMWRAQIAVKGRAINLGRYATEGAAAMARDLYVRRHQTGHEINFPH